MGDFLAVGIADRQVHRVGFFGQGVGPGRDVIAFLGEGWEPACAAFDGKPDDFEKVRAATGKESTTLKSLAAPLTDDRIGLWRRVLDETELAAVRTAADGAGLTALYDRILAETPDGAAA